MFRHLPALAVFLLGSAFAEEPPREAAPVLTIVRQYFAQWDADRDGVLGVAEIDRAISNPGYRADAAAALVALKRTTKSRKEPLTLDHLAAEPATAQGSDPATEGLEKIFAWAQQRIAGAPRDLFASQPPRIDSIRQGKLGDCFCLAALRSWLNRDPASLTHMIWPQPDGSYLVQIGAQKVAVPALTDAEIALGASANDGLWPLVYEKGVGLARMKEDAPDATPWNTVTKGGSAGSMMSALTQHAIQRWSCQTWRESDTARRATLLAELRAQLHSAQAERRLVTGGTGPRSANRQGPPGILYNHGYSVLRYDEEGDTLRLWNPHGDDFHPKGTAGLEHGYPMERGEFDVPLPELVQFFGGFAFEQPTPAS
jgi:hypothetical protein